ncbi:MAG TPA: hypothetical protein VEO54_26285 [Thermoanaerobaculia bacterium]|nr:hypothetical protein [Thermoanaerobaculia bacterium]
MSGPTLEQARAAKNELRLRLLGRLAGLRGLGIVAAGEGYGVKVLVDRRPAAGDIPDDVDGVPVFVDVAGQVTPL